MLVLPNQSWFSGIEKIVWLFVMKKKKGSARRKTQHPHLLDYLPKYQIVRLLRAAGAITLAVFVYVAKTITDNCSFFTRTTNNDENSLCTG